MQTYRHEKNARVNYAKYPYQIQILRFRRSPQNPTNQDLSILDKLVLIHDFTMVSLGWVHLIHQMPQMLLPQINKVLSQNFDALGFLI